MIFTDYWSPSVNDNEPELEITLPNLSLVTSITIKSTPTDSLPEIYIFYFDESSQTITAYDPTQAVEILTGIRLSVYYVSVLLVFVIYRRKQL